MMLKGAREQHLLTEIEDAKREIKSAEKRLDAAQKALDTIRASGEKYVGEIEEQKEKQREKEEQARKAAAGKNAKATEAQL